MERTRGDILRERESEPKGEVEFMSAVVEMVKVVVKPTSLQKF